ncbi:hypothetical protein LCGC14_2124690, partial [marine sediment metagenome]
MKHLLTDINGIKYFQLDNERGKANDNRIEVSFPISLDMQSGLRETINAVKQLNRKTVFKLLASFNLEVPLTVQKLGHIDLGKAD